VINIRSIGGKAAMATYGAYAGAKFALEAVSDSLRREVAPLGVQVVVVEPGGVRTEMATRGVATANHLAAQMTPEQEERYGGMVQANNTMMASERRVRRIRQPVCATRTTATLWCWGDNTYGQQGQGDTTTRTSPLQVGAATTWTTISTAKSSTCATRTDGTLWCWGYNSAGQLGLGDTTQRLTPTQVAGTTWTRGVYAGRAHHCAIHRPLGVVLGQQRQRAARPRRHDGPRLAGASSRPHLPEHLSGPVRDLRHRVTSPGPAEHRRPTRRRQLDGSTRQPASSCHRPREAATSSVSDAAW
jgi:hypothetical protein